MSPQPPSRHPTNGPVAQPGEVADLLDAIDKRIEPAAPAPVQSTPEPQPATDGITAYLAPPEGVTLRLGCSVRLYGVRHRQIEQLAEVISNLIHAGLHPNLRRALVYEVPSKRLPSDGCDEADFAIAIWAEAGRAATVADEVVRLITLIFRTPFAAGLGVERCIWETVPGGVA